MKKITESELISRANRLREKVIESEQVNEVDWGGMASNAWKGIKGAGTAIGNALSTTGGKVAGGAALGAGALAAGQAAMKPGQAPAPAGTTARVPGKSDPAVLKQQQDLIAKGAKIKADGIMGPATQAAIAQFGGGAPTAPAAPEAPAAPAAPEAPGAGAELSAAAGGDAAKNPTATNAATAIPSGPATAAGAPAPAAAAPATAAPATAAAPTKAQQLVAQAGLPQPGASAEDMLKNMQALPGMDPAKMMADQQARMAAMKAKQPAQSPQGYFTQQGVPANESIGFQNEELNRIVSLVHYR
jgi:hypothetical protein